MTCMCPVAFALSGCMRATTWHNPCQSKAGPACATQMKSIQLKLLVNISLYDSRALLIKNQLSWLDRRITIAFTLRCVFFRMHLQGSHSQNVGFPMIFICFPCADECVPQPGGQHRILTDATRILNIYHFTMDSTGSLKEQYSNVIL